jgi:hypothetical protein
MLKLIALVAFWAVNAIHIPQTPLVVNPFSVVTWCSSVEDVFVPQVISLTPDIPKRGEKLTILVKGKLKRQIEDDSRAHVKVKLGFIQLIDQDFNICENIGQVGRECPLEQGDLVIEHQVDIPRELPPVF